MANISLGYTVWLSWGLVGLVLGYMVARLIKPGHMILNLVVGILAAIAGGWVCVYFFGASDKMIYVSLLFALSASGLFLWALSLLSGKLFPEDNM